MAIINMATILKALIFSLKNKVPKTIVKSGVAKKSILEISGLVICNPKKLKSKARKIMNAMQNNPKTQKTEPNVIRNRG